MGRTYGATASVLDPTAFENSVDFICMGMCDFQIVDHVNIAMEALGSGLKRDRTWRA